MDKPYRNSDDGKCLISEIEPGWILEYYFVDCIMWVRETRNGRFVEQPIAEALLQSPLERAAYFSGRELRPLPPAGLTDQAKLARVLIRRD